MGNCTLRTKRGVSLTTYGQALLPRASLIVAESRRVQDEIAQRKCAGNPEAIELRSMDLNS